MNTRVHHDENAPRDERWRVLRGVDGQEAGGRWVTVESFSTERQAHAFAQGFTLGSAYGKQEGLLAVANELDGSEWNRETPQKIADLVNEAGFHVERSFGVPVKVGPAGLSDEDADELRGLKVALAEPGGENAGLQGRIDDLEDQSEGVKVMCGKCGSTEFRYEESHPCDRSMAENHGADGLVFYSQFEWYDGDDDPGVVCASCDTTADTREVEINWQ